MGRRRMLQACAAACAALGVGSVARRALAAAPAPLTAGQQATIAAIADTIVPATDTPGAIKAGVPSFITLMLDEWFAPEERVAFVDGLAAFDRAVVEKMGKRFVALDPGARLAHLQQVQAATFVALPDAKAVPFFLMMKRLTVFGYYTSEVGASEELTLNLVPGEYLPCSHVDMHQHAFSLRGGNPVFPIALAPVSI